MIKTSIHATDNDINKKTKNMQHSKFTNSSQDESKVLSDLESRNDIIITQKRWSNLYN